MLKLHPDNDSTTTSLFSTHPGTRERIARIEAAAAKAGGGGGTQGAGWSDLKAILPSPAA